MVKRLTFKSCKTHFKLPSRSKQTFVKHENRRIRHGESKAEINWLMKLGVPIHSQVMKMPNSGSKTGFKYIVVDGYDPKSNTVFEYLGDCFHGYPLRCKLDDYNSYLKRYNRELYYGTIERFKILHELGYKIYFTWETWDKKGVLGRYYYYYDKTNNKWDDLL